MTTSTPVLPVPGEQTMASRARGVRDQLLLCGDPAIVQHTASSVRARGALDRNPTSIVATYLAGATGAR